MTHESTRHRRPFRSWHAVATLAFVVAGALFATTALSSNGLDLRAASITDLDGVVRAERQRSDELQAHLASLNQEVDQLSHQVDDANVARLQAQVDQLSEPAGFAPVTGPGLSVVLDDAPKSAIDKAREEHKDENEYVVHQQDIQAVVNALWAGGAEAMTLQGQRVVSTTGIKCVGNTVMLHGVPYSPPYKIAAIGDPIQLQASLDASDYVADYLYAVDTLGLGYDVATSGHLEFPGYEGSSTLKYAKADTASSSGRD
ncbi:MAG: DUF881 domain-containing protein [Propionibacteriales bacterium]|nr:DUF881 domain-containing protein [Propionibacteriales bacterium]